MRLKTDKELIEEAEEVIKQLDKAFDLPKEKENEQIKLKPLKGTFSENFKRVLKEDGFLGKTLIEDREDKEIEPYEVIVVYCKEDADRATNALLTNAKEQVGYFKPEHFYQAIGREYAKRCNNPNLMKGGEQQ